MGGGSSDLTVEHIELENTENSNTDSFLHAIFSLQLTLISISHCGMFLIGTQVYILNGTDPEGDPVRFGLTFEKGSTEYFRVEPKSGNVTLIQELDREVSLLMRTLNLKTKQHFGQK